MNRYLALLCLSAMLMAVGACGRPALHADLDRADSLASVSPLEAMRLLDSLAPAVERAPRSVTMRWRLLSVKAADKAYITHTSDSMLRPALDYYAARPADTLRPEALYYAGRVFSDMGDYPRALDYYGLALEATPPGRNLRRCAIIHDQMRYLYSQQFLYPQKLAHARASLDLAVESGDTFSVIQGWTILAGAYRTLPNPDSASACYDQAVQLAEVYGDSSVIDNLNLSRVLFYQETGRFDRADSILIHAFPTHIPDYAQFRKNQILADYYLDRQQWDSCIYYSNKAIEDGRPFGRRLGHRALAHYYLHTNQPQRALMHIDAYHHLLDSLRRQENQALTLRVEAAYNYSLRERDNERLSAESARRRMWIVILAACALVIAAVAALLLYRQRLRRLELSRELERVRLIIASNERLEDRISSERSLMESGIVHRIRHIIDHPVGSGLVDAEWDDLRHAIAKDYPGFFSALESRGLNATELRISMLIKIGVSQKAIGVLLGQSGQSVGMTRLRLAKKHLDPNARSTAWDAYIASL